MRVFVGWAYEADWIETYALPIIESFGVEIITGKELQGQVITSGVKQLIDSSDAVVAFTTRRDQNRQQWTTSDWVVDEIKYANAIGKSRILEVREEGVDYPNEIHGVRQYIMFPFGDRLACLRDLAKAVSRWTVLSFKLTLLPEQFIIDHRRHLLNNQYTCKYTITRRGNILYQNNAARISREGVGVCIYVNDLPADIFTFPDALLEVEIMIGGQLWTATRFLSSYEVDLESF